MTNYSVCLGGHDLEMAEIARLLKGLPGVEVHDLGLSWGAKASAYEAVVRTAISARRKVVLVELQDDLPEDIDRDRVIWIDHHGDLAGKWKPASIEQLFDLLRLPRSVWTRDLSLVVANDRGHIAAMIEAGATMDEIRVIRLRDRSAQGITADEERQGCEAAAKAISRFGGRLTVVRSPHERHATVTDALDSRLGGPGYQNLLILSPLETAFFGDGNAIANLRASFTDGWCGGELPERGFWGCGRAVPEETMLRHLANLRDGGNSIES